MNITNLGIGSGLPLESLVEAYINAEAIPQEIRLQEKEESLGIELSGVGSFKSSLSTFQSILDKLTSENAFDKQSINVSDSAIDVTTNGYASNGSFSVEVEQLAQGSKRQSTLIASPELPLGSGSLSFDAGTDNNFTVALDGTETLSEIKDKINAESENFGVTANIINTDSGSYLVYNSTVTGEDNNLTVSSTGDASLGAIAGSSTQTAAQEAKNAIVYIDGNKVENDTNEFKNTIEDVTITAKEVNMGSPSTLEISQDTESASELINEFINGFNTLVEDMSGLGAPKQGRLAFDPNLRSMKQQMADTLLNSVPGLSGAVSSLSDIGIELNRDGELEISSFSSDNIASGQVRLDNALSNNLNEVGELFASSGGIGTAISTMIDSYIDSDGVLTKRQTTLNERISDVSDEWGHLEERLRSYEETLRKQFTALDATVAGYNATSDWIGATLSSLLPQKE